jgi:hypothetical protein
MKKYTAKDIVKVYSELKDLIPDVNQWTEAAFKNSKPRLIRLNQLVALKKAFKIDDSWEEFERGSFVDRFPIESYNLLKQNIKSFKNSSSWNSQNFDHFCYRDLQVTFRLFLDFVVMENTLKNHISEYSMTYSLGQNYGYEHTKSYFSGRTNKKIQYMIDDLVIIIDPLQQVFSEGELINAFNFPKENLEEIDSESW